MANWLPMALAGVPHACLLSLLGSSVASWEELRGLFTACLGAPAIHAVAGLLSGSQELPSDRHVKQFFRQVGAAHVQQGAPPGWAAPKADLTFDSRDHPTTTAGAALAKFMVATHLACNLMKMPGSSGVLTVAGDTKEALAALKFPQQRRARPKKVSFDEDGASGATFTIGANFPPDQEKVLVDFLRANKGVFAWEPRDLDGIPRRIIEHHLRVCPNARPVKQKARRQSTEKQSFIVQETRKLHNAGVIREVYCYTCMSFGLRNAGATFQRLMHIALGQQLGRNAEAYVDDIVVKSWEARTLIDDLEETFTSLRVVDLRLNLEKCVFGIPSSKLLGFLVSHRGIKANPEKLKAIERMSPPQTLKEMQKLVGCVTSLGCFISKLGERALPFFKLMKKKGQFEWTPEADAAFQDLKWYLTIPPVMVAPRPLEPLVLYLAATPHSASAALVAVQEEHQAKGLPGNAPRRDKTMQLQDGASEALAAPADDQAPRDGAPEALATPASGQALKVPQPQEVQDPVNAPALVEHPVYFVRTVLRDARARYPMPQKLLLVLLVASRKLPHYFQGHPVKFVMAYRLERVLRSPNAAGIVAEWNIKLQVFPLEFSTTRAIKGAMLADFVAEWTDVPGPEAGEDRPLSPGSEAPDGWGEEDSNNTAEYEGLIAGLKAAAALGVKCLTIKELQHLPRGTNKEAYDISKRASRRLPQEPSVFQERLFKPSAAPPSAEPALPREDLPQAPPSGAPACGPTSRAQLLPALEPQEGCWTEEFKAYLLQGTLPEKKEDAERVARQPTAYCIQDGELYRKRPNDVSLWCISREQGHELLADIHGGDCGHYSSSRTLVGKAFWSGFYWPTALSDATELVRS
ncbi:uncharacterized protein [Aegilops tauschii subsp. strangulata]|uniref:uncharacterized protein n=1 Tax=Aegilops tauschii subsp. strangulata TaxID=200361 RepID=UPI003CC89F2C